MPVGLKKLGNISNSHFPASLPTPAPSDSSLLLLSSWSALFPKPRAALRWVVPWEMVLFWASSISPQQNQLLRLHQGIKLLLWWFRGSDLDLPAVWAMGGRRSRGLWAGGMGPGEALPWGAVAGFECTTGFDRESSDQAPKLVFSFWFCYIFSHPWVQKSCPSSHPSLSHCPRFFPAVQGLPTLEMGKAMELPALGADSCVTQPAEEVTTPMERMCFSYREKRMVHHGLFMRVQGMERGGSSPSCMAQGGLEVGQNWSRSLCLPRQCEEAGVSMKNKTGPPALVT